MIAEQYRKMLDAKSVIRQLSEKATKRAQIIGAENVFDYSLGNPSVPAPAEFKQALLDLIEKEDPMTLHGYSPTLGIPSVKTAIAESLNCRFDMNYGPEHIFPVSAAAAAIAHALRAVTVPGDEVLTFAPFFPEYHPYVDLTGAVLKVVPADTKSFQINFEAFEEMLGPRVAAVLVNTPNNPSGAVYSAETLTKLAEVLTRKAEQYGHDIFLISDEPYREIVFDGKQQPYVSKFYANTISCYSFSKALSLPGERIGYLAVNPACPYAAEIVNMCGQISRGIGHNCPTSLMQLAVSKVLDLTSDFSVYEKNRNLLYECLTDCGFEVVKPEGTFYIFPKAPEADAAAFCQKALQYDLVLVPADSFGTERYDLVLLDLNLPGKDGMTVLRTFRQRDRETPVLILSARSEVKDKVEGLDAGANDYLSKPFHLAELEARIRSLTLRQFTQQDVLLTFKALSFDTRSRTATVNGQTLALTRKETGILEYLMVHQGRPVSQEELMEHVWDNSVDSFSNSIRVHISALRKKLRTALGYDPIRNRIGEGYLMGGDTD